MRPNKSAKKRGAKGARSAKAASGKAYDLPVPPNISDSDQVDDRATAARRLREARINAGYAEPKDAWSKFGWKQSTYSGHENGTRGIPKKAAEAYAKAFNVSPGWLMLVEGSNQNEVIKRSQGVEPSGSPMRLSPVQVINVVTATLPILGYVEAGVWTAVEPFDKDVPLGRATVSADPRFSIDEQFVLEVRGDSMNAAIPPVLPGALIHCLRYGSGPDLRSGDLAVVVLTRSDGRYEATLKRVIMTDQGMELRPESHNKAFKPIQLWNLSKDIVGVHIEATVEAVFYPMRRS